jgi:predicted dehydrogenase
MKISQWCFVSALSGLLVLGVSCEKKDATEQKGGDMKFTGAKGEVKIITLDPGHFHAALVQKTMYDQVDSTVYVYAPDGPDVQDHLNRINGFNTRSDNPTNWEEKVYKGADFNEKMLAEKKGNMVVLSGNNKKKTEYIKKALDAGLNVLADKPMCITPQDFQLLQEAFASAKKNDVLLYDIMTERYEITSMLQKELANTPEVFGDLQKGSLENPAVVKESVHHFFKYVAGNKIKRPPWYFDTTQQGEGLVDVSTHLVDLVMWACFPEESMDYQKDIQVVSSYRWPTLVTQEQFATVTRLPGFPEYLKTKLNDQGILPCYSNGEINFTVKGVHAKTIVIWNYQAPEGAKDTHYSIMRGTKANVIIKQGKEQNYKPELYVEAAPGVDAAALGTALTKAIADLQEIYPGVSEYKQGDLWHIEIPEKYHVGHEAHFGQVTEWYLQYLVDGDLPDWEVPNMIAKYYTTTTALGMAKERKP